MKILAIGSHPDDLEYGCGGTLARYAQAGHEVTMLVMTCGERGEGPGTREAEARAAAAVLGAEIIFGGYEDTRITLDQPFIAYLESQLDKVEPDIIFVHHGADTHQDHRAIHNATLSAARYVPNLMFYEGPTTIEFQPTIFVDISKFLTKKIESLKEHRSQVTKTNIPGTNILEMAVATATFRGTQGRVGAAEGFGSARLFLSP